MVVGPAQEYIHRFENVGVGRRAESANHIRGVFQELVAADNVEAAVGNALVGIEYDVRLLGIADENVDRDVSEPSRQLSDPLRVGQIEEFCPAPQLAQVFRMC
ncbi:MAG TPA: hypothetical protein VN823_21305 [Stellaceae bacterium]|nr:hypothetical protein [Stellaceae bacterium]